MKKNRLSDNKNYYDYLLSEEFGDIDKFEYYIEEYLDEIETEIAESKKNYFFSGKFKNDYLDTIFL